MQVLYSRPLEVTWLDYSRLGRPYFVHLQGFSSSAPSISSATFPCQWLTSWSIEASPISILARSFYFRLSCTLTLLARLLLLLPAEMNIREKLFPSVSHFLPWEFVWDRTRLKELLSSNGVVRWLRSLDLARKKGAILNAMKAYTLFFSLPIAAILHFEVPAS